MAGAKTPTGQTASEKRGISSKLNLKFSAHSDKHNTHIRPRVFSHAQQASCDGITVPLQYIIVPEGVFGEEQTSQIFPRAFSDKIVSNSKRNKTKTSRLMGWIKTGPNKLSNENFVRQRPPAKTSMHLLDKSVLYVWCPHTILATTFPTMTSTEYSHRYYTNSRAMPKSSWVLTLMQCWDDAIVTDSARCSDHTDRDGRIHVAPI